MTDRRTAAPPECSYNRTRAPHTRRTPKHVSEDVSRAGTERASREGVSAVRNEKARQTFEAQRTARAATTLRVGTFTIEHIDPFNWAVIPDTGKDRYYYPTLPDACKGLLRFRIGDHARRDLQGVLQAVRLAEQEIVRALQ